MAVQHADVAGARSLDILGINEAEERIYRWLLLNPRASVAEMARGLSLTPGKIHRILEAIEAKGMVTHTPERPCRYLPVSPDIAMEALILQRQNELLRAQGVVRELQAQAASAQSPNEREQTVELVSGCEAGRQVFEQMHRTARHEVLSLVRPPLLVSRLDLPRDQDQYDQRNAQARGVYYRSVVDAEFLELPFAIKRIREDIESGEDFRNMPRLPFKMILADRRFAIIPLDFQRPEGSILLVRSVTLLDALYALFGFIWERATPVLFTEANEMKIGNRQERISEDFGKLLSLLATGMNDKNIMYELGMSRSTYSRRIADIMKTLNASTRFQLGWLAKEHMSAKIPKRQSAFPRPV